MNQKELPELGMHFGGGSSVLDGMWRVEPETGQVSLTDQALQAIINTDPIEKWYTVDPEPIAR